LRIRLNIFLAVIAAVGIATALVELHAAAAAVQVTRLDIEGTPATLYRPASGAPGPMVLIAHGFAGSQQLMQSFALTFARNGYSAMTFDFPGHGRNPAPLTGSITDPNGATQTLVAALTRVARVARAAGDGRLAVLGHSMASDIVVRYAKAAPDVTATIAVSMFSPAVTATLPRNLLIIVGDWESMLKREALRALDLATAPAKGRAGVTYGDFADRTARRVAFSAHVEHVSVLFSSESMREALAWLDHSFGMTRTSPPLLDPRGPWILLLVAGVVLLARPLSQFLPRVADHPVGAGMPWRRLWIPMIVPMIVTPLVLRVLPTHFLPVLVGDYLAAHFAMYGAVTALCLLGLRRGGAAAAGRRTSTALLVGASLAVIAYGFVALVWPINAYVTSFLPGRERALLILVMLVGTLSYFLSDEWLTRADVPARGAYLASKIAFLLSIAIAVALDLQRLFFLIIIIPVILLFFLVYGLFSKWTYARTGHPFVAGFANAVAFAWAIGVTFPLLAG
jgi:pimeloyl-ACP methyl ester carboxylesterase